MKTLFGTHQGQDIFLYTLKNRNGMEVEVLNFGAIVRALRVPDRLGQLADVVLGYDTLEEYVADPNYFGCVCGRYANRIGHGRFSLGDESFALDINNPPHHLHGGPEGFHKQIWQSQFILRDGANGVVLKLHSPDGHEGYPGDLDVELLLLLTQDNALHFEYTATCDRATVLNLTHHGYFHLAGAGAGEIGDHWLTVAANALTPSDETLLPKGKIHPVDRTPFDFRKARPMGKDLRLADIQLLQGDGYDHNLVLTLDPEPGKTRFVARVEEPHSGRMMELYTDQPGLQLYTANHLNDVPGKEGKRYDKYGAFCLEAQHFPDSPNQPEFPSTTLSPGERYSQTTIYRFSTTARTATS